jgi:hypothetical protein
MLESTSAKRRISGVGVMCGAQAEPDVLDEKLHAVDVRHPVHRSDEDQVAVRLGLGGRGEVFAIDSGGDGGDVFG